MKTIAKYHIQRWVTFLAVMLSVSLGLRAQGNPNPPCFGPAFTIITQSGTLNCGQPFHLGTGYIPASLAALVLDGVDDYATFQNFNLSAFSGMSIEGWIMPDDLTTNPSYVIIAQNGGGTPDWMLSFENIGSSTFLVFDLGFSALSVQVSPATYAGNGWHHIAATYDGSTMLMYSDGNLIGSQVASGPIVNSTAPGTIGSRDGTTGFFKGEIDELRVWGVPRSLGDLISLSHCRIGGGAIIPDLVVAWNMDEMSGTTLNPTSSIAGTVHNGATWNPNLNVVDCMTFQWAPATGLSDPNILDPVASPVVPTIYTLTASNMYGCSKTGTHAVSVTTGASAVSITPSNPTICGPTRLPLQTQTLPVPPTGRALNFSGNSQDVALPPFDLSSLNEMTIEAWIRPTDISTNTWYEIARQQGTFVPDWIFSFQNHGTILAFGLHAGGAYNELDVPINAADYVNGQWHHVAATYDGSVARIFHNGVEIGAMPRSGNIGFHGGGNRIGSNRGLTEFFRGSIDEVRFWKIARTPNELQKRMECSLDGTTPGLYAMYHLDNAFGTTASDAVANLNGTINGATSIVSAVANGCCRDYSWSPAAGLNYTDVPHPIATITGPVAYTVTVSGCGLCTATATTNISYTNSVTANAGPDMSVIVSPSNPFPSVTLQGSGTGTGLTYSWSPAASLSNPNIPNPVASPTVTTVYTLTVSGANGCVVTDEVTVYAIDIGNPETYLPCDREKAWVCWLPDCKPSCVLINAPITNPSSLAYALANGAIPGNCFNACKMGPDAVTDLDMALSLALYPNPAQTSVTAEIHGLEGDSWRLELYDVQGRRVREWPEISLNSAGEASIRIDLRPLPMGVFFLNAVSSSGSMQTKKLVHVK